jgi:hypothetical protein
MRKFVLMPAVVLTIAVFMNCAGGPEKGDQSTKPKEAAKADVQWDNSPKQSSSGLKMDDDSGAYLIINNNINEPLILFAGAVNNNYILGGIRAMSTRRINFYNVVTESAGTFLLRAVKENVYRSKGSGIGSDDVVFAHIVTYDKRNPRTVQLNIDKRLGGQALVVIENHTRMALEVVLNSPDAETLTTLAPGEMNRKVYLDPDPNGYVFYPIFKYYDKTASVIQTVETDRGTARRMNPENPAETGRTITIKFDNVPADRLTFRFATIIVRNEGEEGIFLLEGGGTRLRHQNNGNLINPGNETFNIFLDGRAQDRAYQFDYFGKNYPVRRYNYKPGNTYQITFNSDGTSNIEDLKGFDVSDLSLPLINQR